MPQDGWDEADTEKGRVRETPLPGVGVRYEFVTAAGEHLAVLHHRTGRRELVLYSRTDPDSAREVIELDERDSRTLAELLGGAKVVQQLARLQQSMEGLAIDWLAVREPSRYVGRTIGDTGARTRTGSSIVAVLRGTTAIPAREADFRLQSGDTLVVVGTPRGIESLSALLRDG